VWAELAAMAADGDSVAVDWAAGSVVEAVGTAAQAIQRLSIVESGRGNQSGW